MDEATVGNLDEEVCCSFPPIFFFFLLTVPLTSSADQEILCRKTQGGW